MDLKKDLAKAEEQKAREYEKIREIAMGLGLFTDEEEDSEEDSEKDWEKESEMVKERVMGSDSVKD